MKHVIAIEASDNPSSRFVVWLNAVTISRHSFLSEAFQAADEALRAALQGDSKAATERTIETAGKGNVRFD